MFSIFGRLFAKSIQEKNNNVEKTAITLNILRTQWKEVRRDRQSLVTRNKTPNTDPLLFKRIEEREKDILCLLYTSPSPRDVEESRMPSSA